MLPGNKPNPVPTTPGITVHSQCCCWRPPSPRGRTKRSFATSNQPHAKRIAPDIKTRAAPKPERQHLQPQLHCNANPTSLQQSPAVLRLVLKMEKNSPVCQEKEKSKDEPQGVSTIFQVSLRVRGSEDCGDAAGLLGSVTIG